MQFWVDGAQDPIEPVEPFVRSIALPVRAENDAIEPLMDGFDRLPLAAGRLGSAEMCGASARGLALGEDYACVHGQERHDHRTGIGWPSTDKAGVTHRFPPPFGLLWQEPRQRCR
jgi:hypothetical protein